MRFSLKSGSNIGIHTFSKAFLEKLVFHIKPSEFIFSVGMSESCLLDSETWFLECGILQYWIGKIQIGTWADFKSLYEP